MRRPRGAPRAVTVVGASLAGLSAARALRAASFDGRITLIGTEERLPYDRPPLSKDFLVGTTNVEDIALLMEADDALDIEWRLGCTATRLDAPGAAVVLEDASRVVSDGVVLATGARARRLTGARLEGVHTLRTLDDALALRQALSTATNLVVVGAGFVGAEVASTARGMGLDVTVVEALPIPLAGPLGAEMGSVCAGLHADNGVRLIAGVGVDSLVGSLTDEGTVRGVRLHDGRELAADVVLVAVGSAPNVEWLHGSGLEIADGVVTDAACATSIPGVVATGDCAASYSPFAQRVLRSEHWTNAFQQPAIAVATLLGVPAPQPPLAAVPYFWSDQYGARIQFAGHRTDGNDVEVVEGDVESRRFVAVYRSEHRPVAVLAMNFPKPFGRWRRELAAAMPSIGAGQ